MSCPQPTEDCSQKSCCSKPVMSDDELFEEANKLKTSGNDKFKAKKFLSAIELYDVSLNALSKIKSLN